MVTKPNWDNSETGELVEALLSLKNEKEAKSFLRDLLTDQEILELGRRWRAAHMLFEDLSYSTIEEETGLSSTTIARISKSLRAGAGGYLAVLKRMSIE